MLESNSLTVMSVQSLLVQGAKEDCEYRNVTYRIQAKNVETAEIIFIGVIHSTHMMAKAHAITDLGHKMGIITLKPSVRL